MPSLAEYERARTVDIRERRTIEHYKLSAKEKLKRSSKELFEKTREAVSSSPNVDIMGDGKGVILAENIMLKDGNFHNVQITYDSKLVNGDLDRVSVFIGGGTQYLVLDERGEGVVADIDMENGISDTVTASDVYFYNDVVERFAHPEGLTCEQEKLAPLLFTVKIEAPAELGKLGEDGQLIREKITTDSVVAFAPRDGFVFKHHDDHPKAPLSPDKMNFRGLTPELLDQLGTVYAEAVNGEKFDYCTGIPNAGVPLALAFSEKSGVEYLDVFRKEEKDGGRRVLMNSEYNLVGKRVLIIDDVIAAGLTKDEVFAAIETSGAKPSLLVGVDREEGGLEAMLKRGRDARAAMKRSQLLMFGVRNDLTTNSQFEESIRYSHDFKKFQASVSA